MIFHHSIMEKLVTIDGRAAQVALLLNKIFTTLLKIQIIIRNFDLNKLEIKANGYNIVVHEIQSVLKEQALRDCLHPADKEQIFLTSGAFYALCLEGADDKNVKAYEQKLLKYKPANIQEKYIIDFYTKRILHPDVENHPLVVLKQITRLIEAKNFTEAALLLILKRNAFFGCENTLLITEIVLLQMQTMRQVFVNNHLHLLSNLCLINFTSRIFDDVLKAKFSLLAGSSAVSCRMYQVAIDIFSSIEKLNCREKQKAKANYMIGMIYEFLFLLEKNPDFLKTSKNFLSKNLDKPTCFWTFLSRASLGKKPKIISIYDAIGVAETEEVIKQQPLMRARLCWENGQYKMGIQYIHSLKQQDFERLSPLMIETIKFFIKHKSKAAMYKIGILCFKYTGKIIRECFNFPSYLNTAIQQRFLSTDEAIELMAIASEESKLLDHVYYNLDTPCGLGIFQLNPTEIKKFIGKIGLRYSKSEFLSNSLLQTRVAIEILRYHKAFVHHSLPFALFYFVSGHQSYELKDKTSFLKQKHPLFSAVILAHVVSGRTRRYLIGVLEFILLQHLVMFGKFPKLDYLL